MAIEMNQNPAIPYALHGENAQKYINKFSILCPNCLNAQTNVVTLKNISKEFEKDYVQFVWNSILDKNMKLFTKKQLMSNLQINHLSNGALQDKALTVLVMLGYIRKEQQIFHDKNKNEKTRYIYIKNIERKNPICYDSKKDKHIPYNWFNDGLRKDYYKNKKKKGENNE